MPVRLMPQEKVDVLDDEEFKVSTMANEDEKAKRKAQIAEWQKRLKDTFSYNEVVGGRLLPTIMQLEKICGQQYVYTYKGHRVLADSFLDFFAITLSVHPETL